MAAAIVMAQGCAEDASTSDPAPRTGGGGKGDSAWEWCNGNLDAEGGVEISIDYQVKNTSDQSAFDLSASPVWINVRNDDFGPSSVGRAVIVERTWDNECGSYCRDNYSQEGATYMVDLAFEHGRLTGEAPLLGIQHHDNNSNGAGYSTLYEIAVVVDDVWYKGVDGKNLRFIPTSFQGFCARGTTF